MQIHIKTLLLLGLLGFASISQAELTLKPIRLSEHAYAIIGDLGGQSVANEGLNNNLGFIVGEDSVLVINSGPTQRVARALQTAIQKITPKPIKAVVNVNSQSHYWLGNGHFQKQGIPIIAQREADRLMHEMGNAQLQSTQTLLKEKAADTNLSYPTTTFIDKHTLSLGKTKVELLHFGNAHTPGDLVVWLPQEKILFAGDLVFTQRLLAVLPIGSSGGWIKAFDQAMALQPRTLVPGHGQVSDLKTASKDTRDYLQYLRKAAQDVLAKNGSLQDAVDKTDQSRFKHLVNFELLAKRNMNQVFTEMERESF